MNFIVNFIDWLVGVINAIWQFVTDFFANMINLIQMLVTTVANVSNVIIYMPTWLQTFAIASMSVTVMYLMLGRSAGKSGGGN